MCCVSCVCVSLQGSDPLLCCSAYAFLISQQDSAPPRLSTPRGRTGEARRNNAYTLESRRRVCGPGRRCANTTRRRRRAVCRTLLGRRKLRAHGWASKCRHLHLHISHISPLDLLPRHSPLLLLPHLPLPPPLVYSQTRACTHTEGLRIVNAADILSTRGSAHQVDEPQARTILVSHLARPLLLSPPTPPCARQQRAVVPRSAVRRRRAPTYLSLLSPPLAPRRPWSPCVSLSFFGFVMYRPRTPCMYS